ncbi:MAG: restriction endonuclease subunit S [Burkholderiales bacterium]|nr:restriction endonuclease subunit S [Burkholderiales bacterium]
MTRFATYPELYTARHAWLGEIPSTWCSVNIRLIAKRYSGGTPDKSNSLYWTDGTIPWLNSGEVNQGTIRVPTTFITEEALSESSARWVPANAIIIALAGQGKTKGMAAITAFKTTCNQSMAAVVFEIDHPKFMYWWLVSQYRNIRGLASDDARDGLNLEMIATIPCPRPSAPEQEKIAAFLDWKTGQIDALIARKKELLERLREKRLAVITQAVTQGLNPAAAMRDSGIPWLGQVPQHWEVKKISYFARVVRGASPRPAGDPTYFHGEYMPWITVGEITKDEQIYLQSTESMLTEEGASNSRVMTSGSLVVTNSGATLGVPKILALTGCANDGVVAFEDLADNVEKIFVYYFLESQTENLRERMKQGGGQPNLNTDIIKALSVPFPPMDEQTQIAQHLQSATAKLASMTAKVVEVLERLSEYRAALIAAATTGKIDVRNVNIPA